MFIVHNGTCSGTVVKYTLWGMLRLLNPLRHLVVDVYKELIFALRTKGSILIPVTTVPTHTVYFMTQKHVLTDYLVLYTQQRLSQGQNKKSAKDFVIRTY